MSEEQKQTFVNRLSLFLDENADQHGIAILVTLCDPGTSQDVRSQSCCADKNIRSLEDRDKRILLIESAMTEVLTSCVYYMLSQFDVPKEQAIDLLIGKLQQIASHDLPPVSTEFLDPSPRDE